MVYTYSIFDADPAIAGSCVWPAHDGVEINAKSADAALSKALAIAAGEGSRCGEYEPGDILWVIVWDADGKLADVGSVEVPGDDE